MTQQQDLKFDKHISEKMDGANGILGTIKHVLRITLEKSKKLAFVDL